MSGRPTGRGEPLRSRRSAPAGFRGHAVVERAIGSEYEYSNLGVGLLGHVLSRVAGVSYEAPVRERILDPLGMRNTGITLSEEMRARLTRGHDLAGAPAPLWDLHVEPTNQPKLPIRPRGPPRSSSSRPWTPRSPSSGTRREW